MTVRLHKGYSTTPNTYIEFYSINCNTSQPDIALRFPSTAFPRIPLVTRNLKMERTGETGYGMLRCDMELDSFIVGNKHSEIVGKYLILENLVGRNDLFMSYVTNTDSGASNEHRVVYNKRVYIDGINEPQSWKQHDGDFKISLHYFINVCDLNNSFGIEASFDQFDLEEYNNENGQSTSIHSYKFDPPPLYSAQVERVNSSHTSSLNSPSGEFLRRNRVITLNGILKADTNFTLSQKMGQLEYAFSIDGVLNYGQWSKPTYVQEGPIFEESLPHSHVKYTIKLVCYENEIQEMQCSRTFSRVHRHLKVEERLYCLKTEVEQFHMSGQYVDYEIRLKAKNRQEARNLLKRELQSFIFSSGAHEVPGGNERWEDDRTIIVNLKKYYKEPILYNVETPMSQELGQPIHGWEIPAGVNLY